VRLVQAVWRMQAIDCAVFLSPNTAAADHPQHVAPERCHIARCSESCVGSRLVSAVICWLFASAREGQQPQQAAACRCWATVRPKYRSSTVHADAFCSVACTNDR
jgi:hypothetical protein